MPVRPRNCHTRRRNPRQGVTPSVGGNGVPPTLAGGSTPHTWTGSSRVTATGYASSSPLACAGGRRDAGPVRSGTLPAVSAKPNLRAERNLAWRQVYVDRPRPLRPPLNTLRGGELGFPTEHIDPSPVRSFDTKGRVANKCPAAKPWKQQESDSANPEPIRDDKQHERYRRGHTLILTSRSTTPRAA